MARVRLRYQERIEPGTRSPGEFASPRAAALEEALVAAGAPGLLPTYDMLRGEHAHRLFQQAVMDSGYSTLDAAAWPHDGAFVTGVRGELFREGTQAFYRLPDGTLALVSVSGGWARASIAGSSNDSVRQALAMFETLYPATFLNSTDARVPVTFWMNSHFGPVSRLRMIDAAPWSEIGKNYSAAVREQLAGLMDGFEPGKGGQLILWQGPPGTGKSWALRALISEWLGWAEFHYITDPDSFFVESAAYMVDVLLADSYSAIDAPSGSIVDEANPEGKWRILILEDTGELLSAGAKEKYGQGLSRLLNVVDGLIGQGLRVLVLVTTNDELGELNAAVRRPGRCASQIVFTPLSVEEAAEWLGVEEIEDGTTLAELYAREGDGRVALEDEPVADDEPLVAAGNEDDDPVPEIRRVAASVAPDGGYGETGWNAETGTVFWVCADWTTEEEHTVAEDAFLAIPGVDNFDHEAEAAVPDGYEQVWPVAGSEEAYQRVLELARRPLEV